MLWQIVTVLTNNIFQTTVPTHNTCSNLCSCSSLMSKNILNSLGSVSTHVIMFCISKETSFMELSCRYLLRIDKRFSFIFVMLLSPSWSKIVKSSMKIRTVLSLKMGMQQVSSCLIISSFISSGNGMYIIITLKGIPSTPGSRAWGKISVKYWDLIKNNGKVSDKKQ